MDFIYTVDPDSDEPKMLINKSIGDDIEYGEKGSVVRITSGIDGARFVEELMELDRLGKKRVEVWICSEGGSVMDGLKICTAILNTKCKVDTYNGGIAASIAGVIFLCGRKRYMADYSSVMMHDPYGSGNSKALEVIKGQLVTLIAKRTGLTEERVSDIMKVESWIRFDEAVNLRLCTDILETDTANTGNIARTMKNDLSLILNKINDQQKNKDTMTSQDLKKVTSALKLNGEASAEAIFDEVEKLQKGIDKVQNSFNAKVEELNTTTTELNKLKNSMKDKDDEFNKMKKDFEDKSKECAAMKEKMDKHEAAIAQQDEKMKVKADAELEDKTSKVCNKLVLDGKLENKEAPIKEKKEILKALYKINPVAAEKEFEEILNSHKGKSPIIHTGSHDEKTESLTIAREMIRLKNEFEQEHVKN